MPSKTAVTEYRRKIRHLNAGRTRRHAMENKGTTPSFPIHTPEADANAPDQARKSQD